MIKGYKFLVNEEEKSRILNLHKNRTSSQYLILEEELTLPQTKTITFSSSDADSAHKIKDSETTNTNSKGDNNSQVTINSEDKRNLKFNNEGESSKKFTYMDGSELSYNTHYNKDKDGKYNGDIYRIDIFDSDLTTEKNNVSLYVYGKPQDGAPDPTEIKFSPNDKEFIKFQDLLDKTKTKEEWDKLVQDSLGGVTPTITPNSQSQTQTKTKIEFRKPTDHKTALDQIKKELNVQQGDNISDAVLKFLKANTPKN